MWSCTNVCCAPDRFFYGLQWLRNFEAATPFLQHAENTLDVALGPFEPFENIGGKGGVCRHDHIRRLR